MTHKIMAGGLLCGLAVVAAGCGSVAQVRIGGEPTISPRAETVLERVCAGDEAGAARYLAEPEYRLSSAAREDWLSRARADKRDGKCPCPEPGCEAPTAPLR